MIQTQCIQLYFLIQHDPLNRAPLYHIWGPILAFAQLELPVQLVDRSNLVSSVPISAVVRRPKIETGMLINHRAALPI